MTITKCPLCNGRLRPIKRAWTPTDGGVSFYKTIEGSMERYNSYMKEFAKRVPIIHELCARATPELVPAPALIALNLQVRLQ